MLYGNQLAKELVEKGYAQPLQPKRQRKGKTFKCNKCGAPMTHLEGTNFIFCPECESPSYFVFSDKGFGPC